MKTTRPDDRRLKWAILTLLISMLLTIALASCGSNRDVEIPSPTSTSQGAVALGPTSTSTPLKLQEPTIQPSPTLLPIPELSRTDHVKGDQDARITLLVYSDFQCPYCAEFFHAWKQIEENHPTDVRLVFRHYPLLPVHDKADIAGAAAEIASRGGKFWELHDALFERQGEWVGLSREEFMEWVTQLAGSFGLDTTGFKEELLSGADLEAMQDAFRSGVSAGIPGTPFIFFNGEWYRLNPTAINLEASIQLELLKEYQYTEPPEYEFNPESLYFAHLQLNKDEIVIQLYPEIAPATVGSFIFLANEGWYDNTGFHRVQAGQSVETGDPSGTGLGGPGYLLLDEVSDTLNFDEVGMVAMSSSGPNTNGSRYFINLTPLPYLDGARTIFGRVISGFDLLSSLEERDPFLDLFEPYELLIQSIRIETR